MIALANDCLLFRFTSGDCVPFSADMISVELMGQSASWFDQDFVKHAAQAVFHYFKHELRRQTVTVGEFAAALEKVLRGFTLAGAEPAPSDGSVVESDLRRLANESSDGCELVFFPKLRQELRRGLKQNPRVLRFRGLRGCVKQLTGARRWGVRCRNLEAQILSYLHQCLDSEAKPRELALLVE
ncbi:MAG TPA: hypothetical protein VHI52_02095 [Verrucomicrobiae bacterium]|nr:hypothetical protein [Verrucomicrobiae bacterium]